MNNGGHGENGRYMLDHNKGLPALWNMKPQHSAKDQNALAMNKKLMVIVSERDAAIQERNMALADKKAALADRDVAIMQRDQALNERNTALLERDNAIAALQYHSNGVKIGLQRGVKRMRPRSGLPVTVDKTTYGSRGVHITDALPITAVKPRRAKSRKEKKIISSANTLRPLQSGKRIGEDLNRQILPNGTKTKNEWDHDMGLNQVAYDDSTMPAPVCSCTGVYRQCYKWGNGGWQSSCCTTTLSAYPLPSMPNKRHTRMGGRKMSGTVFTRLLSRLAAEGHDLSVPLDLKDHWARHGTNRYITIK